MEALEIWNTYSVPIFTISSGLGLLIGSFYYYTKSAKDNRKEEDTTEARIKELWKERFELQDKKIDEFRRKSEDQSKEMERLKEKQHKLEEANYDYVRIFQGRDADSLRYREEGRQAMNQIKENVITSNKILEAMETNNEKFNEKFNTILQEIQKIYAVLAQRYLLSTKNNGVLPENSDTVESVLNSQKKWKS